MSGSFSSSRSDPSGSEGSIKGNNYNDTSNNVNAHSSAANQPLYGSSDGSVQYGSRSSATGDDGPFSQTNVSASVEIGSFVETTQKWKAKSPSFFLVLPMSYEGFKNEIITRLRERGENGVDSNTQIRIYLPLSNSLEPSTVSDSTDITNTSSSTNDIMSSLTESPQQQKQNRNNNGNSNNQQNDLISDHIEISGQVSFNDILPLISRKQDAKICKLRVHIGNYYYPFTKERNENGTSSALQSRVISLTGNVKSSPKVDDDWRSSSAKRGSSGGSSTSAVNAINIHGDLDESNEFGNSSSFQQARIKSMYSTLKDKIAIVAQETGVQLEIIDSSMTIRDMSSEEAFKFSPDYDIHMGLFFHVPGTPLKRIDCMKIGFAQNRGLIKLKSTVPSMIGFVQRKTGMPQLRQSLGQQKHRNDDDLNESTQSDDRNDDEMKSARKTQSNNDSLANAAAVAADAAIAAVVSDMADEEASTHSSSKPGDQPSTPSESKHDSSFKRRRMT